jgi:cell division septation protein DedD
MLRRAGYPAFTSEVDFKDKGIWHRIFVGSFATREEAEVIKNSLEEDEISDGFIRELPYAIQINSAFNDLEDVKKIKKKIDALHYLPYTSYILDKNKNRKIRLLLGAFKTRGDASSLLAGLRKSGLQARVVNR